MTSRIPSRYYTRALLIIIVLGVGLSFYVSTSISSADKRRGARNLEAVKEESARARRAECEAVNRSVEKIRLAVINVAGYQAPIVPGAPPSLVSQIVLGNARRRVFAVQQAASIPGITCNAIPKSTLSPPTSSTSSTTVTSIPH